MDLSSSRSEKPIFTSVTVSIAAGDLTSICLYFLPDVYSFAGYEAQRKRKHIVNISVNYYNHRYAHAHTHIHININPKPCSNHHVVATDNIYHLLKSLGVKQSTREPTSSWENDGSCLLSMQPSADSKKINSNSNIDSMQRF